MAGEQWSKEGWGPATCGSSFSVITGCIPAPVKWWPPNMWIPWNFWEEMEGDWGEQQLHKVLVLVAQSCLTLCHPMDCSPPDFYVYGIFQARILEWVVISFSRGSSRSRDWSWVSCTAGRFLTDWATSKALQIQIPYKLKEFKVLRFSKPGIKYRTGIMCNHTCKFWLHDGQFLCFIFAKNKTLKLSG